MFTFLVAFVSTVLHSPQSRAGRADDNHHDIHSWMLETAVINERGRSLRRHRQRSRRSREPKSKKTQVWLDKLEADISETLRNMQLGLSIPKGIVTAATLPEITEEPLEA